MAQRDGLGAPKEGLALRIEAKRTECIVRGDCSALLFGTFWNFS
jgi:hypothetical protein